MSDVRYDDRPEPDANTSDITSYLLTKNLTRDKPPLTSPTASTKEQPPPPPPDHTGEFPSYQPGEPPPALRQVDPMAIGATRPDDRFTDPTEAINIFKNPAFVLAGLASMLTRAPITTALNAGAAAMKGFHQGQMDVYQRNKERFDENLKMAMEQNRVEIARYNSAWDRRKEFNWEKVAPKMYEEAARNGDVLLTQALNSHNWELVEKILLGRETAEQKYNNLIANLNARAQVEQNLPPTLTDTAILQYAQRENAGDHSWRTGLGRGIQGKADINAVMNKAAQLASEAGKTGADIAEAGAQYTGEKAYQRTAGSYASRVESAVNEATGLVPQALEASRNLPRGRWIAFNEIYQKWQQGTSDPAYNDFMAANIALLNTYMRAMNPQGVPRITERLEAHAIGLLSTATSQEAYEVQVRRLWKEMQISKEATAKTRAGVGQPEAFPEGEAAPKVGDRKQFKQGVGVWNGETWVPEAQFNAPK